MITSKARYAFTLLLACLPAVAAVGDSALGVGQAHNGVAAARTALGQCNLPAARQYLNAVERQLQQLTTGTDVEAVVTDEAAVVRSELEKREALAARAEEDLKSLMRRRAWQEAEIRLATEDRNGCAAGLEGFRRTIRLWTVRPVAGLSAGQSAGRAVRIVMILGSIAGSGYFTYRQLNRHGIFPTH